MKKTLQYFVTLTIITGLIVLVSGILSNFSREAFTYWFVLCPVTAAALTAALEPWNKR